MGTIHVPVDVSIFLFDLPKAQWWRDTGAYFTDEETEAGELQS